MELKVNGKKKGGVFSGIIGGLILLVIGAVLLWWNEGRTVKTEGAISEFESSYIEVDSKSVNSSNNGKAIYTHGSLVYDELGSTDSEFNITVDSAVLERTVEMYQWKEECTTDSDDNETCNYNKVWSSDLIDSSEFKNTSYTNPTEMKYNSDRFYASSIKIDAFDISNFESNLSTKVSYKDLSDEVASSHDMVISGEYYTTVKEDAEAQIGDIRVKFDYNDAKELSVIGLQNDESITNYVASNGYSISKIKESNVTAKELIGELRNENNIMKWVFRLVGTLLIIMGLISIISPIQKLASYIPILGNIFNTATSLIMAAFGLLISFVIIAIAWFRYRPVLSIILIVIGIAIVVLANKLKKNKTNTDTNQNVSTTN